MIFNINTNGSFLYAESYEVLQHRLYTLSNRKILEDYHTLLLKLSNYPPIDEEEKKHILFLRKIYIDEIKRRIKISNYQSMNELIKRCDRWLELDKTAEITSQTLDLIRIRTLCLNRLEVLNVPQDVIKKEYL